MPEEVSPHLVIRMMEYRWAQPYCTGKKVMDLNCDKGSGSKLLAVTASEVLGVDTNHSAIEFAKKSVIPANVQFRLVVEGQLPFDDDSFDVVVAFNYLEGLYNPKEVFLKINRILKPGGVLIVSTVNRLLRLYFWQKPYNTLHFTEYSPTTFKVFLSRYFHEVELHGIMTTGPYFPDLLKNIQARKFRLGIYYPVRNFLRYYVRPLFTLFFPKYYPPLDSPLLKGKLKKSSSEEKGIGETDFELACMEVQIVTNNLNSARELIALCKKE